MKVSRSIVMALTGMAVVAALAGCGSNSNPLGLSQLDTTPPPAPTNLHIVYDANGASSLAWDASAAPDVVGYQVEVASASSTDVVQADPSTSYVIPSGATSVQETYRVRAVDAAGNLSAFSAPLIPSNAGGPEGAIETF